LAVLPPTPIDDFPILSHGMTLKKNVDLEKAHTKPRFVKDYKFRENDYFGFGRIDSDQEKG